MILGIILVLLLAVILLGLNKGVLVILLALIYFAMVLGLIIEAGLFSIWTLISISPLIVFGLIALSCNTNTKKRQPL